MNNQDGSKEDGDENKQNIEEYEGIKKRNIVQSPVNSQNNYQINSLVNNRMNKYLDYKFNRQDIKFDSSPI